MVVSPSSAVRELTRVQVGVESTAGDEVDGTRRLITQSSFRREQAVETFEGQNNGTFTRSIRAPVATRNGGVLECETGLDFEQILLPLLTGLNGGVTPTQPDAINDPNAYLWTFTPSTTAPDIDTYTIECTVDDGTDQDEWTSTYGFTTELEISGDLEGTPQMRWTMMCRKGTDKASATGIAVPSFVSYPDLLWKVYIDGTWANLGTTQIQGQVIGFTYRINTGLFPRYTLDGRTDLDFTAAGFSARSADLTIDILHSGASGDAVVTERGNKESGTRRAVRLELDDGSVITGGTTETSKIIIDGFYEHAADSLQDYLGADTNGELITSMHFLSNYESAQAQDIELAITSDVATFP